jgi:hypothetical protein
MSCADVCVYHDWDGSNEFYAERRVIARKAHRCVECRGKITPGQSYDYSSGKCEGEFFSARTCLVCVEVREAFVCDGAVFGMLWESVEEELFPRWRTDGPFECLAKLSTPEARAFCQSRFAEWEADHV